MIKIKPCGFSMCCVLQCCVFLHFTVYSATVNFFLSAPQGLILCVRLLIL